MLPKFLLHSIPFDSKNLSIFLTISSDLELEDVPGMILKQAMEKNNKKYIFITFKEEYRGIIEKMANFLKNI